VANEQKLIVDTIMEVYDQTNENVWVRANGGLRHYGQLNGDVVVDVGGQLSNTAK
jgi:hypothetical protein